MVLIVIIVFTTWCFYDGGVYKIVSGDDAKPFFAVLYVMMQPFSDCRVATAQVAIVVLDEYF